jgi:serine/threonine protein kinase
VYQELELVRPVTTVFECQDPNFNELRSSDNAPNDKKEWLWQFWGRLLILEVPYYEGRHFAESPSELLSVVEWLIELHEAGYVHGDIRPFNVVFHEKESRLIDLDLGGKLSEGPTYPEGYVVSVDGISRLGKAGKQITKSDDWYALLSVIFKLHVFSPVSETPFSPEARSWLLEQNDITPHQITELRQFLKQRDLKIQPELDFLNLLKAYGHYPLRTKGAASTAGTGTPPKK